LNLLKIVQFSFGPIIAAGLGLVTIPIITWFFSVEDVGRLTIFQVVVGASISIFSLAMHQAYVREYHEVENKHQLLKVSMLPGLTLLTVIIFFVAVLPYSFSFILFERESKLIIISLVVGVVSNFLLNFLLHVIRMEERAISFSIAQILPKAFLLISLVFIAIPGIDANFQTLIVLSSLSLFTSLIICSWMTRDTWVKALKSSIDLVLLKELLKFSLPLVFGGMAYWGLTTIDRLFLSSLSGFEELGVYAVSVTLASSVTVVSMVFSNLWHPVLYRWVKEGVEPSKIVSVIEYMALAVAFIWGLVGILSPLIPWFLPEDYKATEYLVIACVAMPLFYMFGQATGVGIGIKRKSNYAMLASVLALLANVGLNFILVPNHGAAGAAVATLISFFVFFIVRTESSARIWWSFPRIKLYIIVVLYMMASIFMVMTRAEVDNFAFVWIMLLLMSSILYRSRLVEIIVWINSYRSRKV
jgi:O-antigen/teichoic acid export membrane protein